MKHRHTFMPYVLVDSPKHTETVRIWGDWWLEGVFYHGWECSCGEQGYAA